MEDTCEYSQFISSDPDIVISMLGGKESMNYKNFTPDYFVQRYSAFIKSVQGMPSKP